MVNMVEVNRMKDAIRRADALDRWDMAYWANGIAKPNADDAWDCGAAFCAAGWVTVINGYLPAYQIRSLYDSKIDDYVSRPVVCSDSFVEKGKERDLGSVNWDSGNAYSAIYIATNKLEITDDQAKFLFVYSENMTDIETYFELVDFVVASEEFDTGDAYAIIEGDG